MNRLLRTASVFFALSIFSLLPACSSEDPTQTASKPELVILGGMLLDMVADEPDPVRIKALVVRDGLIDRIIAADSAASVPAATTTIDAGENYILPGYFDAHVHFRPWLPDASIWKRASSYYGITTLFDTGPCGDHCAETGQDPNEWINMAESPEYEEVITKLKQSIPVINRK